jgi:hypothetical protein
MKTEFEFTLPQGFIDSEGQVHRQGRMRMAMALDEVEAMQHPQVQANEAYLPIVLLARVVVQLGELTAVTPELTARLFAADLAYLEDVYQRINTPVPVVVTAVCPNCTHSFHLEVAPLA